MPLQSLRHKIRFKRIVEPCRADVHRFLLWLCHDPALAEDVLQETLLRAWRALDSLEDTAAARPWLLTIARRELARTFSGRPPMVPIDALAEEQLRAVQTGQEHVEDMRRAVRKLELAYREPLILQVWFGYTTQEIAEHMQLNQQTVLTRLYRARQKLQQLWSVESGRRDAPLATDAVRAAASGRTET